MRSVNALPTTFAHGSDEAIVQRKYATDMPEHHEPSEGEDEGIMVTKEARIERETMIPEVDGGVYRTDFGESPSGKGYTVGATSTKGP